MQRDNGFFFHVGYATLFLGCISRPNSYGRNVKRNVGLCTDGTVSMETRRTPTFVCASGYVLWGPVPVGSMGELLVEG